MTADSDKTAVASSIAPGLFGAGFGFLLVAVGASLVLALKHWTGMAIPGCGAGGGCDLAADSVWGAIRVGGFEWPTSHIGLAYFLALAVAWIMSWRGAAGSLRWIVRAGGFGSVFLVGVMIAGEYLCPYCVLAHSGNVGFLIVLELARRPRAARPIPLGGLVGGLIGSTSILAATEYFNAAAITAREEDELAQSQQRIIAQSQQQAHAAAITNGEGFTGRYRLGPAQAPIRVVIFMDYQCEDCGKVEEDILRLFDERDDMSISVKHFPFCTDCNRHMQANKHPNACWAARAAETAGIMGGAEAFWEMHKWLFSQPEPGFFDNPTLRAWIDAHDFDFDTWSRHMTGAETLSRVQEDVEEAMALGIGQTPMIFINGVELKGWRVQNGVRRAVEALAATNPPALTAASDVPLGAVDSALAAWRSRPPINLPPDSHDYPLGRGGAPVQVVLWGDLQEPYTAEADRHIRGFIEGRADVQYRFRHYPINQACNSAAQTTKHPQACLAHRAAEAAGQLGGAEAYWAMHIWLMANQRDLAEATVLAAAAEQGLEAGAFSAHLQSPQVAEAINADALLGQRVGLRGVPYVFVNGKLVERWLYVDGQEALTPIIREALEAAR